jgi:arylsulfatase A-like enzyme
MEFNGKSKMKDLSRRSFLHMVMGTAVSLAVRPVAAAERRPGPNVLMIVVDDLNDYVTGMGGHPQARTPNLARLASQGVSFRRAYSNNPICAPSRGSLFTGIYPHTSKFIHFGKWFENEALINSKTIPEYFRDNGYYTLGTGKLLHHYHPHVWQEFGFKANYGPSAYNGEEFVAHPSVPEPFRSIGWVDGGFGPTSDVPRVTSGDGSEYVGWYDMPTWNKIRHLRYVSEDDRDPLPDERCAKWAADKLTLLARQPGAKPFFMGVGFLRPHTPLYAPKRFFDMFLLEDIKLPVIREGDNADTHYKDVFSPDLKGPKHFRLLKESYSTIEQGLKTYVRAYLACVAFVDEQIGVVLDALDRTHIRENTIVLVTSDHGYNMGEKEYLFKNSLWEESGRVPLIIRAPGVAKPGAVVERPVSLIDVYPTLADLCNLKGDTRKNSKGATLDGFSLKPLLTDPEADQWEGPDAALTVIKSEQYPSPQIGKQHYAVRTRRWRYILYNNNAEELYDHDADPYEWSNLADDPRYTNTKAELKAQLLKMTGRLWTEETI